MGRGDIYRDIGLLSVIVAYIFGSTAVGLGLGYFAWTRWGAPWWVLLLLTIGGLALGFYRVYLISKRGTPSGGK